MFSTCVGVIHTSASIILIGCKKSVNSAIFHLFCTFIQGQLVKRKKNNIYPTETFKTWYLVLSMIDMYRSLAL